MPTHYVVRTQSSEDVVNAAIKENEAKGAGLIQVLPITLATETAEVLLVFRQNEDVVGRPTGFRAAVHPEEQPENEYAMNKLKRSV